MAAGLDLNEVAARIRKHRQYDEAVDVIRTTTHRTARIHITLAAIYGHLGQQAQAADEFEHFKAISTMAIDDFFSTGPPETVNWFREGLSRAALVQPAG